MHIKIIRRMIKIKISITTIFDPTNNNDSGTTITNDLIWGLVALSLNKVGYSG